MIKLFRISGDSLYPIYKDGELVIAVRRKFWFKIKPNDIVTFTHNGVGVMIKQVRSLDNSQVFVVGTLPQSLDSRVFGSLSIEDISYKVLFKLPMFIQSK